MNTIRPEVVEPKSEIKKKLSSISGTKCCLPHCGKSKRSVPGLRIFRFPYSNTVLLKKWLEKCNFDEYFLERSPTLYICEKHFSTDCIGKKYLKRDAVPTLNLTQTNEATDIEENRLNCPDHNLCLLKTPPRKRKLSETPPLCTNCLKSCKNEEFYRKKYFSMFKKLKAVTKDKRILNTKNQSLKRKVKILEDKIINTKSVEAILDKLNINPNEKTFCKMLIKQNRSTNARWEENEISFAQSIYYRSTSTYLFLRNILKLNLPSPSSLSRWSHIKNLQPGNNICIYNALSTTVQKMKPIEKECILIFDEVSIRRNLTYNSYADVIDGVVDVGYERLNEMGSQVCVFMIRGVVKNWKFVLNYFVTSSSIKADILKKLVLLNLDILKEMGLNVRGLTCDQGPNNRKCYEMLGGTGDKPYFFHKERKVFLMYDIPHIFKSIRNAFIKGDFKTPHGIARFDVVREIFELEYGKATKMTKLTTVHINPNNFQKMRVSIAVQTLSNSVAAAIQCINENHQFKRNSSAIATSTCEFIKKLDKYFDCLNSMCFNDLNPLKRGLNLNSSSWQQLQDLITYLKQVEYVGNKIFSISGLLQTTKAILLLSEELFLENSSLLGILTSHFNQDPLENLFSYIRAKGGHCKNPSVHEFNIAVAKLLCLKLTQFSTSSNCADDDAMFLPVDFHSILEYTQNSAGTSENTHIPKIDVEEIYAENEEYFNEDADCFTSDNVPIELTSSRYFVGYIAHRISCFKCRMDIIKPEQILTYPSEMFVHTKNYENESDFGSLCAPSDLFFEVCKIHIKVFEKIFAKNKAIKNIKKIIVEECVNCTKNSVYSFWFEESNSCYKHRMEMLNLLVLTLLRKHSTWETSKYKPSSSEKIKILNH